ncbi:MAG: hypothetical protein COU33_00835 [Candidatus Magasanikbacteria bacterium CG10_big_fil_rev_8_21_14_0_10_43_6]|uniref:Methyltransferase n=1 Tax=Candidatus Magasanikbacteria bacterium CG10_big_fil_rev_8_21_14_0_10_43_6 TaxID=1974650 RepID=A0A2M6W231_9BACT|nr:MAG: hypothetical protein COU33_00835 [Candidatus Magasanikbacteria bacterium CG10_big_fil_rev_8_21_14_0_10_43_6]
MIIDAKNKKVIAWGTSKLLELYLKHAENPQIAYVLDSNHEKQGAMFNGLETFLPGKLLEESPDEVVVVIFAVSNHAVQSILAALNTYGYALHKNVLLYSDVFYESFSKKMKKKFDIDLHVDTYHFVKSFYLSTKFPIHTTILGSFLLLEIVSKILAKGEEGQSIAEVGAFNCGNALLISQYLTQHRSVPFYIFDSFEGFPELTKYDPQNRGAGDYNIESTYEYIIDNFSFFSKAKIIKGFVPETFSEIDQGEMFSVVFYDCDLYKPALDTFAFFWDRIVPGGYLVIHDYIVEDGGFTGVEKATSEFFSDKNIVVETFWENTMAVIKKPL